MQDSRSYSMREEIPYTNLSANTGNVSCQQRASRFFDDVVKLFYSVYQRWDKDNKASFLSVSDWIAAFFSSTVLIGGSTVIRWFYSSCVNDRDFEPNGRQSLLLEESMLFFSSLISHLLVNFFLYRVIRKLEYQLKENEGAYPLLNYCDNLAQWFGFIYFFCVKVVSAVIPSFVFNSFMSTLHGDGDSIDCNNLSALNWVALPMSVLATTILFPNSLQNKINSLKEHKQPNNMKPHFTFTQSGEKGVYFLTIPPQYKIQLGVLEILSGNKGQTITIEEASPNDWSLDDIEARLP